ncbi:phosphotransferase family protein [Vineibacter terrae]|uniref:phosphotransferase family protein n=1 Tax=Vineibacter terrae TaxID=2586908 RepID=UPI002E366B85|nr:phosphotransferase family protein [Vineibacter terrae]HEX2887683.1 phosphotransferase family protein [Vineibacter terrae]
MGTPLGAPASSRPRHEASDHEPAGSRRSQLLDGAAARDRFAAWLSRSLGQPVALGAVALPASSGGWSNETLLVDLAEGPMPRVVVRAKPDGPAMFRDYDVGREHLVLSGLAGRAPVPPALAVDPDGAVLGRPLLVTGFVAGRVPSDDRPSFAEAGWLFEAAPADQRRFIDSLLQALGKVHAVDWRRLGLAPLARDRDQPLHGEIAWHRALHDWGAGAERHPVIERGFAAVLGAVPAAPAPCLLWGDARPANVIAHGFEVAALLDWELAGIGPAELDIAWLLEMNRMRTTGSGVAKLPGFPGDDALVAAYEGVADRSLDDLGWYRLFAALKMAVLMERHLRVAIARGRLAAGHRLLRDNVALRRLNELGETRAGR